MYCSSCGEVIKEEAEICPECGVRQKESDDGADAEGGSYGLAYLLLDGHAGKNTARVLVDIVLFFVTVHFWLYVVLAEQLAHWYCIRQGIYQPAFKGGVKPRPFPSNEDLNYKLWSPLQNL